jgi:hypothetical protein
LATVGEEAEDLRWCWSSGYALWPCAELRAVEEFFEEFANGISLRSIAGLFKRYGGSLERYILAL